MVLITLYQFRQADCVECSVVKASWEKRITTIIKLNQPCDEETNCAPTFGHVSQLAMYTAIWKLQENTPRIFTNVFIQKKNFCDVLVVWNIRSTPQQAPFWFLVDSCVDDYNFCLIENAFSKDSCSCVFFEDAVQVGGA